MAEEKEAEMVVATAVVAMVAAAAVELKVAASACPGQMHQKPPHNWGTLERSKGAGNKGGAFELDRQRAPETGSAARLVGGRRQWTPWVD